MSYLVILLAVLTRFIPHMPNFSPIFAALLFGGAHLKQRDAIWYPLALLAASDVVLTTVVYRMRMEPVQVITWLGFVAVALIGLLDPQTRAGCHDRYRFIGWTDSILRFRSWNIPASTPPDCVNADAASVKAASVIVRAKLWW
jgi:hypothetical protein